MVVESGTRVSGGCQEATRLFKRHFRIKNHANFDGGAGGTQSDFMMFPTNHGHGVRASILIGAIILKAGDHLLSKRVRHRGVLSGLVNKGHTSGCLKKIDSIFGRGKVDEPRINRLLVGLKTGG